MSVIRYFVPEDKDIEDKPNAFMIYKNTKDIRLNDIRENFPLPGEYHFRFKFDFKGKAYWLDFNKEETALPLFKDKHIIIKVNRISWNKPSLNIQNEEDFF